MKCVRSEDSINMPAGQTQTRDKTLKLKKVIRTYTYHHSAINRETFLIIIMVLDLIEARFVCLIKEKKVGTGINHAIMNHDYSSRIVKV